LVSCELRAYNCNFDLMKRIKRAGDVVDHISVWIAMKPLVSPTVYIVEMILFYTFVFSDPNGLDLFKNSFLCCINACENSWCPLILNFSAKLYSFQYTLFNASRDFRSTNPVYLSFTSFSLVLVHLSYCNVYFAF
jgi:hypothetical protein